jgi:hypothetical protein
VTGDAAAVELARCLADKIDVWDKIVCYAVEDADQMEKARPVVPTHDNVTPATFLKSLESLGLTVSARGGLVKGGGDSAVFQVPADSALDASTV